MKRFLTTGTILLLSILLLFAGSYSAADEVLFGDVDGDGEITALDASCITRHLTGFKRLDAAGISRADVDGDGAITERDASAILSMFTASDYLVPATKSFSMLVTADMRGFAWDPSDTDENRTSTVMNVAACTMKLREEDPNLLLIDAGGSLLGSSISDDYASRTDRMYGPVAALFVKMQYSAVVLGDEAMSYPSQSVRKEVNELLLKKIPVIGANLRKADPTVFDPSDVLWNDLVPYIITEIPQGEEQEPMRIAIIGMTQPDLCPSDDEVLPASPIEVYAKLRKQLKNQVDYTVLFYHGNIESDALGQGAYALRDFIKKTDSIDLVVASHNGVDSTRSERNASGHEIPIISLKGGADTVTKISVSMRSEGLPAVLVKPIETKNYVPDDNIKKVVKPYVNALSGLMDGVVCHVEGEIDAFEADSLGPTDSMEITHEMQIFAASSYIRNNGLDMPPQIISIAYPYVKVGGYREGPLRYRELYGLKPETPQYRLIMVRGSELKNWLAAYTGKIMDGQEIYSLYGLSYLLNSLNPDTPLGFLEHSSGIAVEDDEVFTVIIGEKPEEDSILRPYLDEAWMPYADRVIENVTLPEPNSFEPIKDNPVADALIAYFESVGIVKIRHQYSWILI